jgi:DNA-directed RNA polymerase subunit M/transcription elongation factor TFIIS
MCDRCSGVFIVKDDPERTRCRTCGKSHEFEKLKVFYESKDRKKAVAAKTEVSADDNEELKEQAISAIDFDTKSVKKITKEKVIEEREIEKSELVNYITSQAECTENEVLEEIDNLRTEDTIAVSPDDTVKYISSF